jgi:hypothetical protein
MIIPPNNPITKKSLDSYCLNQRTLNSVEQINFTNFSEVLNNWNLIEARNPDLHLNIYSNLQDGNLSLLDKGFKQRHKDGKLSDHSFNLISEYTLPCLNCCRMDAEDLDATRYRTTNPLCGKDRYCPRCSFKKEQQFYRKFMPYYSTNKDFYFYFITLTDKNLFLFNYNSWDILFEVFNQNIDKAKKLIGLMVNKRSKHKFMDGVIWSHEAACLNLEHQIWNNHLHLILAAPKGSVVDLTPFEEMNIICSINKIDSPTYFNNCLRYIHKPMNLTIKDRYSLEYTDSNSAILYRNTKNSIEVLNQLFKKRKHDTNGFFRI